MMARFLSVLLCVVGVGSLLSSNLHLYATADNSAENPRSRIAVIDMAQVFKSSKLFDKKREALKAKIAESELNANHSLKQIEESSRQAEGLEAGSEDRRQADKQLIRMKAEFEEFRRKKSRDFLKQESLIYLEVYDIVTKAVASYAQAHEIDLVMRTNNESLAADQDPTKLLQAMNKQILYENKLDITETIIAEINDR